MRDVPGVSMGEVHDPALAGERARWKVVAELILFEVSVESLDEVA